MKLEDLTGTEPCATCGHERRMHIAGKGWCNEDAPGKPDLLCHCRAFVSERPNV